MVEQHEAKEQTPAAHWRQNGEADPFGKRYECERASLPLGNMTDDELANAVFMYGDSKPSVTEMMNGATLPIVYLTAAKERIRWLSRQLERVATLVEACEFLGKANRAENGGDTGAFRDGINWVIAEEQKLSDKEDACTTN